MIYWVLGLCLAAMMFAAYIKNKVNNRRIDRHNRNVDRHNEMIEKLQQQNETADENEN
jgi:ribosomal protein L13E